MSNTLDLAREAIALAEKASPGPWVSVPSPRLFGNRGNVYQQVGDGQTGLPSLQKTTVENCAFIAHAGTHYREISAALLSRDAEVARLREALGWYARMVADCRKVTSEGDTARQSLDRDGGSRADAALRDGEETL